MDREDFSPSMSANLVEIPGGVAFLPPLLPPVLTITPRILQASDATRGAISEFVGQARVSPEADELRSLILHPAQVNEAISTNRIEGIHTQVVDLLIEEALPGTRMPPAGAGRQHPVEVANAAATIELGRAWIGEGRALSIAFVRDLHARLLQGVRGEELRPGLVRNVQVVLGREGETVAEARYVPPPPEHIQPLLENCIGFMAGADSFSALVDTAVAHYQFEAIHPFADGNGRLGRVLVPLQLISRGAMDRTWTSVSVALDARRDEYLARLRAVSTHGEWEAWICFFLAALQAQAVDSGERVQRLFQLRERYREAASALSSRVPGRALDLVLRQVFVSVPEIANYTGSTYPTAKAAVDQLVKLGVVAPWGKLAGRQYWHAAEVLAEVYERPFAPPT